MKSFSILAVVSCLCALQATAERDATNTQALADFDKFTSVLHENNRALRTLQDIRGVQQTGHAASHAPSHAANHATKRTTQYQREGTAPSGRGPANIVYGKGRHAEQPKYTAPRAQYQKAKPQAQQNKYKFAAAAAPSEDSYDADVATQYAQNYKPNHQDAEVLQKYMQKYANQLYAAQKHAAQLSDSQKYVLGQDQYAKKHIVSQQQKYQAPKFIPLQAKDAKESYTAGHYQETKFQQPDDSFEAVEPITATEKYQNFQVQHKLVVQAPKTTKSPPKKAYSYTDNSSQYTSLYGNSLEPQLVNQYLSSYAANDKEAIGGYEGHQAYGTYGVGASSDRSEAPKITGYKIPSSVALTSGHHFEEKGAVVEHHHHHEEHYPHAEPKYEYMYQVQDHEKHNHFGHSEARKGKSTWGRYYVQLPDGRFETVKYWADKTGYHAEVDFKGHAKHPSHKDHGHSHGHGSSYINNSYKGYGKSDDTPQEVAGYGTSELTEEY